MGPSVKEIGWGGHNEAQLYQARATSSKLRIAQVEPMAAEPRHQHGHSQGKAPCTLPLDEETKKVHNEGELLGPSVGYTYGTEGTGGRGRRGSSDVKR